MLWKMKRQTTIRLRIDYSLINISFENDRIYMSAPIGCVYSEYMAPDYDNAILVKAELIFNEDMSFYPIWYITANE
jgi:hypothetical protein